MPFLPAPWLLPVVGDDAILLEPLIADRPQEMSVVLMLRALGHAEVSLCTQTPTTVHPRETFCPAIRLDAAAIVVAYIHQSGDAGPSPEDIELTQRLIETEKLLSIPVLNHLILGVRFLKEGQCAP